MTKEQLLSLYRWTDGPHIHQPMAQERGEGLELRSNTCLNPRKDIVNVSNDNVKTMLQCEMVFRSEEAPESDELGDDLFCFSVSALIAL